MVLTPLGLLAFALRTWFVLLSFFELAFLAYRFTRPLAIHPPLSGRTVRQAAWCLRNIATPDESVAPWTREEVSERVRMIVAECAGVAIEQVTEDTRLQDLFG
jgi:hypothetical protein